MLEPPKNIESGQSLAGGVCSKIREILSYLERSRLIPGSGIRLMETPCGITVSAEGRPSSGGSGRKAETAFPEYAGPWGIYRNGDGNISAIPGLIWTPDGTYYKAADWCAKPSATSWIVLSYSGGVAALSAMRVTSSPSEPPSVDVPDPYYFNNHAILGYYDAENDAIRQVHFSPVVFMIATEDLVITP